MDRHPKSLTTPWHRAAQQQQQEQRRWQQPHSRCPPQAVPGLVYSQPLTPEGISQPPLGAGKGQRGRKRGSPTPLLPCPRFPLLHVALARKSGKSCGHLLKPAVFGGPRASHPEHPKSLACHMKGGKRQ